MAFNARISLYNAGRVARQGPSRSLASEVSVAYSALGDYTDLTVVCGRSASAPAAYTDIYNPWSFHVGGARLCVWECYDDYNFYKGMIRNSLNNVSTLSVGDHYWVALYENSEPSGADAPDKVFGPFLVVA